MTDGACIRGAILGAVLASAVRAGDVVSQPFAPRSRATGATMFTRLDPARTGIVVENNYADPAMWAEHYNELIFGGMGTGVAIGDFDNDGRPDVFVVSKTESSRLFRNLGDWRFEDVTAAAGLLGPTGWWQQGVAWAKGLMGEATPATDEVANWKQGAVFVDVNNDGWLDLHLCRFGAPNQLYINHGDGTFTEEAAARGLALSDGSGTAAFGDYDRDGWLDVYVQTNMLNVATHPHGQPDHLFHNNGDGTFTDVSVRAGISGDTSGHAVMWWDYDQDGWPDLYVDNDFAVPDSLYRNNHDGTFTNVINTAFTRTPYYSMGSDLADVDNDGDFDLFVADMAASTHERDQRGMSGSRARGQEHPADPAAAAQYMHNALYLQTGVGHLQEGAYLAGLAATDWTWSPRFEDLDNDGRVDLHVTNGMIREYHNSDFLEQIMISESRSDPVRIMRDSPVMAEENFAFRNLGDLHFENVAKSWGLDEKGVSFGAAFGDLDGDGDLDLVYANYEHGPSVLRNDAPNGHRLEVALHGIQSNRFGLGATVRIETAAGVQVRTLRATRGYLSASEPMVHFGLGDVTHIERLVVEWPSGVVQVVPAMAADQRLVITERATTAGDPAAASPRSAPWFAAVDDASGLIRPTRERSDVEELMRPLQPWRFDRGGPDVVVADLNGDGHDDLIVAGTSADDGQVLLSGPLGRFRALPLPRLDDAVDEGPLALLDFDGDGDLDLLRTRAGARLPAGAPGYQPQLWRNEGVGRFVAAPTTSVPTAALSVGALAVADFDRDGSPDVFIGARVSPGEYPHGAPSRWWRGGAGRLTDATATWAPPEAGEALVTAAWAGDVDGDGWIDLVVATEWGPVRFWRNRVGRDFEDRTAALGFDRAGAGWWRSIAAGDLNRDGRPDFVVGNVGLNTPYRASPEAPAVLFDGDLGGRGDTLLEAHFVDGRLVPWRNRKDMTAQVRSLGRKYRRNADYALATVDELFGADRIAAARRYEATELRSGVLLSQPDGRYAFAPLPRAAQIAPLESAVVADFDGDGALDLVAVQNDYRPIGLVGHFDGGIGQLLRGDGSGGFGIVPASESGIVVPGDGQIVRLADLDGDGQPDLFITRNNATTLVFRNDRRLRPQR